MAKNKKKKTFVLHDETLNTYGFRMLTSGADLTELRKNPVMLLNHNDWDLPIGRWENIRIEGTQILADAVFDLKDERGQRVSQKVEDDFLRAASIGAWPPEALSDAPEDLLPGQRRPTVTKWKAREASICTIGANHNSLVFYDKEGEPIDLSDESNFIKLSDKPFVLTKTKTMFKELYQKLNLQDGASESAVSAAVQNLMDSNVTLSDKVTQLEADKLDLETKLSEIDTKTKAANKAEAIALTDAAIKDGRFNADQKAFLLSMFDTDHANAKAFVAAAPKRGSVVDDIEKGKKDLKFYDGKSWDELDRANLLVKLKDESIDIFKEKYLARFGKEYQG